MIEVWETYHKQTYRNRCRVMTANGVQSLSVPVIKVNGNHTMTKDVVISYVEPWQQVHRRCLESAYKAAPYFDHYYDSLKPLFETRFERLVDLNDTALKTVLKLLKVSKEIVHTSDYVRFPGNGSPSLPQDFQEASKDFGEAGKDFGEPSKDFGEAGKDFGEASKDFREAFSPKNVPDPASFKEYYQVFSAKYPFAPDLSVLDLLFNEGPSSLSQLSTLNSQLSTICPDRQS